MTPFVVYMCDNNVPIHAYQSNLVMSGIYGRILVGVHFWQHDVSMLPE